MKPLHCVLNELARHTQGSVVDARNLMFKLSSVLRSVEEKVYAAVRLGFVEDFWSMPLGPDYTFQRWLNDRDVDRVMRDLILELCDKQIPVKSDPHAASDAYLDLERAIGLGAAAARDGLAISMAVASRWDSSEFKLTLHFLERPPESVDVLHVCRSDMLDPLCESLRNRQALSPAQAEFSNVVDPEACFYKSAFEYHGGKHVKGKTNEERQKSALDGDGQFLATSEDEAIVSAHIIQGWEKDILQRALRGEGRIERHGEGTFHVFGARPHLVGFSGGSGVPTNRMRVEWSSREVHSHPRG